MNAARADSCYPLLAMPHVLGALWHWLVRRDGVMRRMGFGGQRVE